MYSELGMAKPEVCNYHRFTKSETESGLIGFEFNRMGMDNEADELMRLADETAGVSVERGGYSTLATGENEAIDELVHKLREKGYRKDQTRYYRHDV